MQKPLVHSFSALNTYVDVCPHQYYRRYIKKDQPFVETAPMREGNEGHTAMEFRMGGKPLPVPMKHWEPLVAPIAALRPKAELKLGITINGAPTGFFDADVWFRGKVDVLAIQGTTAFLPDWKFGKSKYPKNLELETNGMLVKAANPYLTKIVGSFIWMKENRPGELVDVSHTEDTFTYVKQIVADIQEDLANGEFEKKRGPLCGYCSVADCHNNPKSRG